jgi:hypothetical protein
LAGNGGWSQAILLAQAPDLGDINAGLAPAIDSPGLGLRDTFKLTLASQIGLELGEYAQHVEERLAGRGASAKGSQ